MTISSVAQLRQQLIINARLPYGLARTAAAESIARRAENDNVLEVLPEALLALVEAYVFGDETHKAFVTFSQLLRLWDSRPELFDESDQHTLFWQFKWIAGSLADYDHISVEQAEALLDDMAKRYAMAGKGQKAVLMSRFHWLTMAGLPGGEEARQAWVREPLDELNDCEACVVGAQAEYFVETRQYERAIEIAQTQRSGCNLEPARTFYALASAYLLSGNADEALKAYWAGKSHLQGEDSDPAWVYGKDFEILALSGNFSHAMRNLRENYSGLLTKAASPLARLRFLIRILTGLAANRDQADMPTWLVSVPAATVGDLLQWVEQEARQLAQRFDQRVAGSYYQELVDRAASAERVADLPLVPERTELPAESPTVATAIPGQENPNASGQADAERLVRRRRYNEASQLYEQLADTAAEDGLLAQAGGYYAEAGQCAKLHGDEAAAHRLFSRGVALLRAGGAPAETVVPVVVAWAPIAAGVLDSGLALQILDELAQTPLPSDDPEVADDVKARRTASATQTRASALDTLARVIASQPEQMRLDDWGLERAVAAATQASELYAQIGAIYDAAHSFWLAGRLQRELGDSAAAIWSLESAFEGFTMTHRRNERAEAANDLIEVLRATGQYEQADQVVAALLK